MRAILSTLGLAFVVIGALMPRIRAGRCEGVSKEPRLSTTSTDGRR